MRALALTLLLVSPTALADRTRVEPTGAPEGEPLKGTVLVWQDAVLWTAPSETAQSVRLATFEVPRKERLGHVMPMRALSAKGAYVEVEPVEADCTWSKVLVPDDLSKLRLFVKRADLAPVLTKPFARTFADGTKLAVYPGAPVLPTTDGWAAVALGGDEVMAEVPAASIGYAYTLDKTRAYTVTPHQWKLEPKALATLGDQQLLVTRAFNQLERKGDAVHVTIDERCSAVALLVPSKAISEIEHDDTSPPSCIGGNLELQGDEYLPKQTALFAGTQQVATAAKAIYLPGGLNGNKTVCVTRRLKLDASIQPPSTADADDALRLCAPVAKVAGLKKAKKR